MSSPKRPQTKKPKPKPTQRPRAQKPPREPVLYEDESPPPRLERKDLEYLL